jgi:hypothetical protein
MSDRKMRQWHFYDAQTGLFSGRKMTCSERTLAANTPEGITAIAGNFDPMSQRVDLETGEVIDYQPPAPDDDHVWSHEVKRWQLKPEVRERRRNRAQARARIRELEESQHRPQRELAIDPDNEAARERLRNIEAEIEVHRAVLAN